MNLKVIIIKRKHIYYSLILVILLVTLILLFGGKHEASAAFNSVGEGKTIKADLNGDGCEDSLTVKSNKGNYSISIDSGNKSYALKTREKFNSLGTYAPYWPMKVTLMDVSRDNIPEIFIQSQVEDRPIQHIYAWDSSTFKNIFSANSNVLGFLDCKNNRTPKILFGNNQNGTLNFYSYMMVGGKLEQFSGSASDNFIGKDTVATFINYVQELPYSEGNVPGSIFGDGLSGKDWSLVGKLASENNTYFFQDAIFMDSTWDKEGNASQIHWTLNFRGTSNTNENIVKNYSVNVILQSMGKSDEPYMFKIVSMYLD